MASIESPTYIRTIEWQMLDKERFIPLSIASSFAIRSVLYPFTVIKTRLQVQHQSSVYSGTFDAFRRIYGSEGLGGLYRGFWISAFQLVSGIAYITTYETVRHLLHSCGVQNNRYRALLGGGCASLVGQTIIVPFDVVSQHMMVLGQQQQLKNGVRNPPAGTSSTALNPLNVRYIGVPKRKVAVDIIRQIYLQEGIRGYYRGYFASLCTYVPNSALWWTFYHLYQDNLEQVLSPSRCPVVLMQCISATLGGATTTLLTNPLDCIRARYQIYRMPSLPRTVSLLWSEEHWGIFTKGLTARMVSSVTFSAMVVFGYETVKRLSISQQYRDQIRW